MPSTSELESKDSVDSSSDDLCECGHTRDKHGNAHFGRAVPCLVRCEHTIEQEDDCRDDCTGYADDCHDFVPAKPIPSVKVIVQDSNVCIGPPGQVHRPVVIGTTPCFICNRQNDPAAFGAPFDEKPLLNELCTCGHAAIVHADQSGNCLALGMTEQTDAHCLEFRAIKYYCQDCGHGYQHHNQHGDYCFISTCRCGAPSEEAAAPEAPAIPAQKPAYRVVYTTNDGDIHAIDVPYGVNASVIDGQLRLWHAGAAITGITANITSIEGQPQ